MSFGADYEFYAISNFNFAGMKAYGSLVSGFCKLLSEATSFAGKCLEGELCSVYTRGNEIFRRQFLKAEEKLEKLVLDAFLPHRFDPPRKCENKKSMTITYEDGKSFDG